MGEDIYIKAVETFGIESQIDIAIEEMSELIKEFIKRRRGRSNKTEIIEEIADVTIMMNQLTHYYGVRDIETVIRFKEKRLGSLIESHDDEIIRFE